MQADSTSAIRLRSSKPSNVPHHGYAGTDRRTGRQAASSIEHTLTTRGPPYPPYLLGPEYNHTVHLRPNLAKRVQPPVPNPLARNRMATSADSSVSHEELSMHGSHARLVSHPADRILSALLRLAQLPVVLKFARVSQWRCRKRTTDQTQNLDFPHWGARARLKEGNHESAGDTGSGSLMLEQPSWPQIHSWNSIFRRKCRLSSLCTSTALFHGGAPTREMGACSRR
jgi:hypothetical protein